MSAEKGLAWFDKGDGRLRKGRAFWFDAELPSTWEGREFLTRYESVEADEIGLAEWVDEHILSIERAETEKGLETGNYEPSSSGPSSYSNNDSSNSNNGSSSPASASRNDSGTTGGDPAGEDGPYRFNLMKGFRGRPMSRTVVSGPASAAPPEPEPVKAPEPEAPKPTFTLSKPVTTPPPKAEPPPPEPAKPQSNRSTLNFGKAAETKPAAPQPKAAPQAKQPPKDPSPKEAAPQPKEKPAAPVQQPQAKPAPTANPGGKLVLKGKGKDTVAGTTKLH